MIDQEPGIRRSVWSRSICCFSKLDSGRRTQGDLESKCQCEQHVYKWGRLQGVGTHNRWGQKAEITWSDPGHQHYSKFLTLSQYFVFIFLFFGGGVLFYYIFFLYHLIPLCSPPYSTHHTVVCVHESSSFLLNLSTPYPPLPPSPPSLAVILPSMSLSQFCLLVQFVHQILYVSEIIWYLSFSDCLILLSIMS